MRPYLYPLQLIAQWGNLLPSKTDLDDDDAIANALPTALPAITALAFDTESLTLYGGDEAGYITAWDISKLVEEGNIKRKASVAEYQSSKFSVPPLFSSLVVQKYRWKAHTDGVRIMQVIEKPAAILSASYDCNVILWYLNGEKMDKLRQDKKEQVQHPYLPVKYQATNAEKPFNFAVVENIETPKQIAIAQKLKKTVKLLTAFTSKNQSENTFLTENEEA